MIRLTKDRVGPALLQPDAAGNGHREGEDKHENEEHNEEAVVLGDLRSKGGDGHDSGIAIAGNRGMGGRHSRNLSEMMLRARCGLPEATTWVWQ